MPDEPENTVEAAGGVRSGAKGDVPELLRRRYFLDERGGQGLGFYADARVATPAFRDEGRRLTASRPDPNAIRDMVAIAQHRGWTVVVVRGEADFRREAWLTATARGVEARGYRPTERDRQELERLRTAVERREGRAVHGESGGARGTPASEAATHANLRIVESVVWSRVADRSAQDKILDAARQRLSYWLARGASIKEVPIVTPWHDLDRPHGRQRSR